MATLMLHRDGRIKVVTGRPKHRRVTLYVTETQYRQLKSALALVGKSMSGWLRQSIKEFLHSQEVDK